MLWGKESGAGRRTKIVCIRVGELLFFFCRTLSCVSGCWCGGDVSNRDPTHPTMRRSAKRGRGAGGGGGEDEGGSLQAHTSLHRWGVSPTAPNHTSPERAQAGVGVHPLPFTVGRGVNVWGDTNGGRSGVGGFQSG